MRRMVVERSGENDAGEAQEAVVPGVSGDAAGRRARALASIEARKEGHGRRCGAG